MSDATTRTLISFEPALRAGQRSEVRCLIAHPMESGQRRGSDGAMLPRNLITAFECRFVASSGAGEPVAQFKLHAAVASNPYIAFGFVPQRAGKLVFTWAGDNGFRHTVERDVALA
jgi:sulfur-oxidizing protein SoxZ